MNYIRIRRRGLEKVKCEIMLMCLGRNIRKFFTLLDDNTNKSSYWQKPTNLKKEYFPYVKPKRKKRD